MHQPLLAHDRRLLLRRAVALATVCMGGVMLLRQDGVAVASTTPSTDRMADELLKAAERADICTAKNAVGVGLRGEYFSTPGLRGQAKLVRVDEVVDFDQSIKWTSSEPKQPIASVRWTGWLKAPISGRYLFHAEAPNMQILVARQLVAGVDAAPAEKIHLDAGRFYPVEIRVSQLADTGERIRLEWTAAHGARYVVPKALLHLPTEMVAAAPR